jgi:hypothetical protein
MNFNAITVAAILAVATSSPAFAQSFTFESSGPPETNVGGTAPDGSAFGGSWLTGSGNTSWADGAKSKYDYKCVAMTQPPRDTIFHSHMICDVMANDGNFAATFGCNPVARDGSTMGCVGGLMGKTGRYAGKRGAVTNFRNGDKSSGTGQWYP